MIKEFIKYVFVGGCAFVADWTTLFLLGEHFGAFQSNLFHWFAYILVASIGLYNCKLILDSIKTGTKLTVIPYGPALIFGAFVVLFLL